MRAEAAVTVTYREDGLHEILAERLRCGDPLTHAAVSEGDTVLGNDCSDGADLVRLSERVGPTGRVLGVLATEEALGVATEAITSAGLRNVELHRGGLEDLPAESSSVDWVIVRGSIADCGSDAALHRSSWFAEIARVLRPGGRALVADLLASEPQWSAASPELHAACITGTAPEKEYQEGLRRAGLVDVTVVERRLPGVARIRRLLASGALTLPHDLDEIGRARLAADMATKTYSAKFSARKPGVDGLPRLDTPFRKGGTPR